MGQYDPSGTTAIRIAPSRADQLLASYLLNLHRGAEALRELILDDIRRFSELGAARCVEELKEVLHRFDEEACENSASWPCSWEPPGLHVRAS